MHTEALFEANYLEMSATMINFAEPNKAKHYQDIKGAISSLIENYYVPRLSHLPRYYRRASLDVLLFLYLVSHSNN